MCESSGNRKVGDFCNLEFLLVNLGWNQEAAERLIHIFLENVPILCERLESAAVQGDLSALKDVLHDIRSSCVLFSGHRCLDQTREIEQFVREYLLKTPVESSVIDWHSMSAPLNVCLQCMAAELENYLQKKVG